MSFKFTDTCGGTRSSIEIEGFVLHAVLENDMETSPFDFDCYTAEDIEQWLNDDGYFCYITMYAEKNGVSLGCVASLCGVDVGCDSHCSYVQELCNDMVQEALYNARSKAQAIVQALTGDVVA